MGTILRLLIAVILAAAAGVGLLWLHFGGGDAYAKLAADPSITESGLETVVSYSEPIGNVAVSPSGRVFFTIHPEARPDGPRLMEWREGKAVPFPAAEIQAQILDTPLGLVVDRQDRLWVVDPSHHGMGRPRLVAVSLATGIVVHEHVFPRDIAPRGSFLQDLQVDNAGATIYLADVSFWRNSPALIVYDVASRVSRRVLENHASVRPQDWVIRTAVKEMRFLGGAIPLKPGLDSIALDPGGQWLYFGAMAHENLFRIPTAALRDTTLPDRDLLETLQTVGRKPLSDGLSADLTGNVYITDVENGAVLRMAPGGQLSTIVRSARVRWPDALSFGPDGWLYLADSALPDVLLKSRGHIEKSGPYHIYRFRPGTVGTPGQ